MSGRQPVADIYIRESTVMLARGYSPREMIEQCRVKAAALGAAIGREVVEVGKRDEFDCPELNEEIDRARARQIDYIISYDMIRLTGDVGKHLWFKDEIAKTGCQIVYVEAEYPATPEGELQETIQGAVARYERLKTRARTQNGIRRKLKDQLPVCNGPAPYGLTKLRDDRGRPIGYAPHETQFPILERIIAALTDNTLAEVCADLNAEAVPTPTGKSVWQPGTITGILKNTTYRGEYVFGAIRRIPARTPAGRRFYRREPNAPANVTTFAIPALVDGTAIDAARSALAERRSRRAGRLPPADDAYTLRGRLRCAHCGGWLTCRPNNGYRRYVCLRAYPQKGMPRTCDGPLPQVPADALEAMARAYVEQELADPDQAEARLRQAAASDVLARRWDEQVARVSAEIADLQRQIDNAADVMLDVGRGSRQYERAHERGQVAEQRLKIMLASLDALERQRPSVLEGDALEEACQLVRLLARGIAAAAEDPIKLRMAYAALGLEGTVERAPKGEGVKLGRDHWWRLAWRMRRVVSGKGRESSGFLLLWNTSDPIPGPALAPASTRLA